MKPTPEEKCEHVWATQPTTKVPYCLYCGKDSSPSPEARVDWEKEAREILLSHYLETAYEKEIVLKKIAKALSAAFEKGREAR